MEKARYFLRFACGAVLPRNGYCYEPISPKLKANKGRLLVSGYKVSEGAHPALNKDGILTSAPCFACNFRKEGKRREEDVFSDEEDWKLRPIKKIVTCIPKEIEI